MRRKVMGIYPNCPIQDKVQLKTQIFTVVIKLNPMHIKMRSLLMNFLKEKVVIRPSSTTWIQDFFLSFKTIWKISSQY